jgi:3-dehydroquinate synthase
VLSVGNLLAERPGRARVAVLSQPGEPARVAEELVGELRAIGLAAESRVLPDGEAAKTLAVAEDVYRWLADLRLTRDDTVLGVGGGALTDLAGFVAATFLRGIEAAYVPTTLLGAVDAAIGGKTAVDLDVKNLVGAFHHPTRVVIDCDLLDALPARLRREGTAEALKAGLVGDPGLVALYEREGAHADLEEVVMRAVRVKAGVVERDPRERGERAHLNYGHTIGHAVEVAADLTHGEAVAVGMVAAGRASALQAGFGEEARQREVIGRLGLPVSVARVDATRLRRLLNLDKKRDAAGLRMVLLEAVGRPRLEHVEAATVRAALGAVGVS